VATSQIIVEVATEPPAEVVVSSVGLRGPRGLQGVPGVPAPSLNPMTWTRGGTQFVGTERHKFYVDHPGTDMGLRATLTTPATGSDFIVELSQNGTVIQLATIPDGDDTSGYLTLSPGTVSAGDYFIVDVPQVGATFPGSGLTVTLWMRVTP